MNGVRVHAFKLRLAGKSYNEIQRELGVPKSTQSGWFKNLVLSDKARNRLNDRLGIGSTVLIKRNKMQTVHAGRRAYAAQALGKSEVHDFSKYDLLLLGAALYWAEGYKRLIVRDGKERMAHIIGFVNSDPAMSAVFLRFLQVCLGVSTDKILLSMRLYPHINESEARRYWMRATGLPENHFQKTTMMISLASKGKRPFNRLPYGTLQVSVRDTSKFHHLLGLIEGVKEKSLHAKLCNTPG
jgi:hypothetical protein